MFTLLLHNPLWSVQHVGPTPIANWLTLAYLGAIAMLWIGRAQWPEAPHAARIACDAATMALIALLAFSLLRQVFAGSVLTSRGIDQMLVKDGLGPLLEDWKEREVTEAESAADRFDTPRSTSRASAWSTGSTSCSCGRSARRFRGPCRVA